jgi:ATP-dependent DNA helicase RecG
MQGRPRSLDTPIHFLKGVGPNRAQWLLEELGVATAGDLLAALPFRYEDRSRFVQVADLQSDVAAVQIRGRIVQVGEVAGKKGRRLVAQMRDDTGTLELVWFKGIKWLLGSLPVQEEVVVFGKPSWFGGKWSMSHPEVERWAQFSAREGMGLAPVYSTTERLASRGLGSQGLGRLVRGVLSDPEFVIEETLPESVLRTWDFPGRAEAFRMAHAPRSAEELERALRRLRWEELFFMQWALLMKKRALTQHLQGVRFAEVGALFRRFYSDFLPFELTSAQKRVIREIRTDVNTGHHMNRLLQGDVGSGKTVVALLIALLAADNGYQTCLMAPTEILANQHYASFCELLRGMPIRVALLTGSVKPAARKPILEACASGELHILVGTHALIEPAVRFGRLGLAIIDEQHRFGVQQRAKLWAKAEVPPHVLVMTATPIPRTLAMTAYGDLDVSVIDELPPGRKAIRTVHRTDAARMAVFRFLEEEIALGRQVYVVYPLIEESATLDHKDLMDGYESLSRRFPLPDYRISIVHGRMRPEDKDLEMQRFQGGVSQILVATTVIEVGVNVPNASVMVIESAERFGLAQLHQLRGRVGRGAEQSYCILMTRDELSRDARLRVETMCRTTDGFEIAEVDMELRGPGDLMGTQQSGVPDLKMADLMRDRDLLIRARQWALELLEQDPDWAMPEHGVLREAFKRTRSQRSDWSRIS